MKAGEKGNKKQKRARTVHPGSFLLKYYSISSAFAKAMADIKLLKYYFTSNTTVIVSVIS